MQSWKLDLSFVILKWNSVKYIEPAFSMYILFLNMGLFLLGKSQLYVNRGIGWSIFPIRFMCPPEITRFVFSAI